MKYLKIYENNKEDIQKICKEYNIENYTINQDGSINVDGHVNLRSISYGKIPIPFNKVCGSFICEYNELRSLKNSPKFVESDFICSHNLLNTLEHGPIEVKNFYCQKNIISDLKNGPKKVLNIYTFENNLVENLNGFPTKFTGRIQYGNNPIAPILDLIPKNTSEEYFAILGKFIDFINDYDVIRIENGIKTVIVQRLYEAYRLATGENLDSFIKGYKMIF